MGKRLRKLKAIILKITCSYDNIINVNMLKIYIKWIEGENWNGKR